MNAEQTGGVSTPRKETVGLKTFSRSNTTSRLTSGTKILALIIVGLCALREKFASVPTRDLKAKSQSSSTVRPKDNSVASAPTHPGTPALRLPASLPRGRRVAL